MKKYIIPFVLVLLVLAIVSYLKNSKPEAKKRPPSNGPAISVETLGVEPVDYQPNILSYGMVSPRVESKLVAQVGGRIEFVSERFRDGSFFKKGDVLLRIEATDYEIEVDVAKANLAAAERSLAEEQAQAEQARRDWERLGDDSEPSPLVLRKPQLAAAESNVASVSALLRKAELNLSRTKIRAPFDGRVLSTDIDLGQVTANNAVLGEIYATDAIEIRLPIKNDEIALLDLPERYSHQKSSKNAAKTKVDIISELAGSEIWQGYIVRTASSIDDASRQLYVVARIDDPFGKKAEGRFPLKIGQYVTAAITGNTLEGAIVIPNKAIYQGSYVYTYSDGAVYRKDIEIQWQNGEIAIIKSGLELGDQLVTSPLGQIASGTPVKRIGEKREAKPDKAKPPKGEQDKAKGKLSPEKDDEAKPNNPEAKAS